MTLSTIKTYIDGDRVTHTELNSIQAEVVKAPDFVAGGTYSPSAAINFGGQFLMQSGGGRLGIAYDLASYASDPGATSMISVAAQWWLLSGTWGANWDTSTYKMWLNQTSVAASAPSAGEFMIITNATTRTIQITRDDGSSGAGTGLCYLKERGTADTDGLESALFVFDGTNWRTAAKFAQPSATTSDVQNV